MIQSICFRLPSLPIFSTLKLFPKPPIFTYVHGDFNALAGRVSKDAAYTITESDRNIIKYALAKPSEVPFTEISTDTFNKIITELLDASPSSERDIQNFFRSLNQDQLLQIAGISPNQMEERIHTEHAMKDAAIKSVLKVKGQALWREFVPLSIEFFHHFMDLFIGFLDLNEIGPNNQNDVSSSYAAQSKFQTYMTIIGYPTVVFGFMLAASGSLAIALPATIATVIGTVAALFIYVRYYRPTPREVMGMDNLTKQMVQANEPPVFHRRDLINQVINHFQSEKGVILVGEPGSGKSSLGKAIAQCIADGEIDFLKKAQFFQANAAVLGGLMEGGTSFTSLQSQFRMHRKKVVFLLDEVHALFEKNSLFQVNQAELLKTFCDRFPYVIIITTGDKWELINKEENRAFIRRFGSKPIFIPKLSPEEIQALIKKQLFHLAPELIWDADVIETIAERALEFSPKTSLVDAAFSLIKLLVVKARVLSLPQIEKDLNQLRTQIEGLQIDLMNHNDEQAGILYRDLQQQLKVKEKEYEEKQAQLARINKTEEQFLKLRHQSYILAGNVKNDASRKKWLENHIFSSILQKNIESMRIKLGLPGRLNKALIDQTIKEAKC